MSTTSIITRSHLFLLSLSAALVTGMQVGSESGTMFAYSSAMDPLGNRFYISGADATPSFGQTTASSTSCYTSVGRASGIQRTLFPDPSICLDMLFVPSTGSSANTQGIMAAMDAQGEPRLYEIQYNSNNQISLEQPHALPSGHFPALIAPDSTGGQSGVVYVALHPTNGLTNSIASSTSDQDPINLQSTHDYLMQLSHPRFASLDGDDDVGYSPYILKHNTQAPTGQEEEWQLFVNTTNGKTLITGMAQVDQNRLVVFGSTTGNLFVDGIGAITGPPANTIGDRWDGFMFWVNSQTGTVDIFNQTSSTHNNLGGSIRSQFTADDFVLGVCMENDKAYVVGHTTGKFEGTVAGGAFVVKLDTDGRDFTWKRQFVGEGIEFTHCTIRGDSVVVGGTIPATDQPQAPRNGNNAHTVPPTQDLVIVQLDKDSGATQFIRQIDSYRNDQLVGLELRGGVDNDVVYVTSNAWNWDAQPYPTNDLFVMTIDENGNHVWMNIDPTLDPISLLVPNADDGSSDPDDIPETPSRSPTPASGMEQNSNTSGASGRTAVAIVIPLIVTAVIIGAALFVWRRQKRSATTGVKKSNEETAKGGDFDDVESLASENKLT